jgi:hypothetical protein
LTQKNGQLKSKKRSQLPALSNITERPLPLLQTLRGGGGQALLSRDTTVIQVDPIIFFNAPFKKQSFPVTVGLNDFLIAWSERFTILD